MLGPEIDLQIYDDEATLLVGLRQGEADGCTCLVKRFASLVYIRALQLVADPDEADNVVQQTFINACAQLASFEGRSGLGTWLYRIATNAALMTLRGGHGTASALDTVDETLTAEDVREQRHGWQHDPALHALQGELQAEVERALSQLPERLRQVFVLREVQGLSTEETAAALGLSVSATKVRLHRARLRLRALLAAYVTPNGDNDD